MKARQTNADTGYDADMQAIGASQIQNFTRVRLQVEDLLAGATPENHERFFGNFHILNQDRLNFIRHNLSLTQSSIDKKIDNKVANSIGENITIHRVWLTNPNTPSAPPPNILRQVERLGNSYRYVFWHNSDYIASEVANHFSKVRMIFSDIRSASDDYVAVARIERAIFEQKFVLAGDYEQVSRHERIWRNLRGSWG